MPDGKPVTSSQIQRIVEAVQGNDAGLAIAIDELFYQAERYGFDVLRDTSGRLIAKELTLHGTQDTENAPTA